MKQNFLANRIPWPIPYSASPLALAIPLLLIASCSTFKSEPTAPPEVEEIESPAAPVMDAPPATNEVLRIKAVGIAFLEPETPVEQTKTLAEEFIQAEGFGFPAKDVADAAQKRLTATEAARYRAMANLVEELLGQEVVRDARVVDMAFAGEEIRVSLGGTLKGVSEVSRDYSEESGMATVVLKVALDSSENTSLKRSRQPLSMEQRKARAGAAARIHAAALLREQIGQAFVEQDIRVENLIMKHQEARVYVQGLLEGVEFSEVRWLSPEKCEVTASLEVDKGKLTELAQETPETLPEEVAPAEVE